MFLNWMIKAKQKFNNKILILPTKKIIITIIKLIIVSLILMKFLQQVCQIIKQRNTIFNK